MIPRVVITTFIAQPWRPNYGRNRTYRTFTDTARSPDAKNALSSDAPHAKKSSVRAAIE